jgi:hypothetical protein
MTRAEIRTELGWSDATIRPLLQSPDSTRPGVANTPMSYIPLVLDEAAAL